MKIKNTSLLSCTLVMAERTLQRSKQNIATHWNDHKLGLLNKIATCSK